MKSIIEARIPNFEHAIYVTDYTHTYHIDTNAFKFSTDREYAKTFEHEDALRISNILYDYVKSQFRSNNSAENESMQNQIQVSAVQKQKEDFPMFPTMFLLGALMFGILYSLAH